VIKKIEILLFFLIILAVVCLGFIFLVDDISSIHNLSVKTKIQKDINNLEKYSIQLVESFYQEDNFQQAIEKAKNVESKNSIYSIIVPHHSVASEFVANMMSKARNRPINTVFVVGPNHDNIGTEPIITVNAGWETPFGSLDPKTETIEKFLDDFNLMQNNQAFTNEHSIGAMAPFIKYYFPEAKIVPIIVSSYAIKEDAQLISYWIYENSDDNSLIIFSIDFSHYLSFLEAEKNDKKTREYIANKDINKILTLNNDYVDSPVSLAASLLLADKLGLKAEIFYHANSADFLLEKPAQTTSYFGIGFY